MKRYESRRNNQTGWNFNMSSVIIYWDIEGRDWSIRRDSVLARSSAHEGEGGRQFYVLSSIRCSTYEKTWLSHWKIRDLGTASFFFLSKSGVERDLITLCCSATVEFLNGKTIMWLYALLRQRMGYTTAAFSPDSPQPHRTFQSCLFMSTALFQSNILKFQTVRLLRWFITFYLNTPNKLNFSPFY